MHELDWPALRGAFLVLALALTLGAAALVGALRYQDEVWRGFEREKGRLELVRARYRTIDRQRRLIENWLPEFRNLQQAGIIGEERRLAWIETLRDAAARVKVPSLRYGIERRTVYETGLGLDAGAFRPFSTMVHLEAGLLHEGDLIRLLRELAIRIAGLHRIDRCGVHRAGPDFVRRPGAVNLVARCDLRLITLAPAGEGA